MALPMKEQAAALCQTCLGALLWSAPLFPFMYILVSRPGIEGRAAAFSSYDGISAFPWLTQCLSLLLHGQCHYNLGMSLQGSQMACKMLSPDTELSPDSEFWSSEQIWTSPIVEAKPFLPNTRLQTHTSWLYSPRDSQESSPAPQFKSIHSLVLSFFIVQISHPYMTTGKTIALTRRTLVTK